MFESLVTVIEFAQIFTSQIRRAVEVIGRIWHGTGESLAIQTYATSTEVFPFTG